MSDRQTANNIIKWLEWQNAPTVAATKQRGKSIDKTIGNAGGSGGEQGYAGDDAPVGTEDNRTQEGIQNLSDALQTGDEPEKFELKDCETGEDVTLDGVGGNGTKAVPPVGFEDCKAEKKPTLEELDGKVVFVTTYYSNTQDPTVNETFYTLSDAKFQELKPRAYSAAEAGVAAGCSAVVYADTSSVYGVEAPRNYPGIPCRQQGSYGSHAQVSYRTGTSTADKQAYIDNFTVPVWDNADTNHLNYNSEKGCIEPLCPDLNPHVLDKFKECQDEMILCDEDGNKVHVKINADGTMDVTQQKHGQTATIKDGKVTSVKKITESQSERIFRN